jgi:tRNA A-37 threonylcarbamoyl transferase component Bud32
MQKSSISTESALADLVSLWQRRRAEGQTVTPGELCRDRPELLPQLEQRIAALERMAELADGMHETATLDLVAPDPADAGQKSLPTLDSLAAPDAPLPSYWPKIPGYEIVGELGRGGMGVVYKARQTELGRIVALKMILSGVHAHEAEVERFRTEGRAIARLQHPNIVQIFEVGEQGGLPFFSLEFCDGGSLSNKLRTGPLLPNDAALLVEQLARAIHVAHQAGIVHRDLKPANILLAANGTAKVTDFGLAKLLGSDAGHTQTGVVVGTPSYMAPEQAGGKTKEVGPATDVYALGAILYELLTGRPPFLAPTAVDTITKVVSEQPLAPRVLQPKVPRDLETVCLKCLEKDPRRRYASAEELADDLQRYLGGYAVLARRPSLLTQARYWARRPERVRDAGIVQLVVALFLVSEILFDALYDMAALFGIGKMTPSPWRLYLIHCVMAVLFALVGIATIKRRAWAVWLGFSLSTFLTLIVYGYHAISVWGGDFRALLPHELVVEYVFIFAGKWAVGPFVAYAIALYSYHVNRDLIRSEAAQRARPTQATPQTNQK